MRGAYASVPAPRGGTAYPGGVTDWPAVDAFAAAHVASGDIDPVYPLLGWTRRALGLNTEEHLAFGVLYVAYYDFASAATTWLEGWRPGAPLTSEQLRYRTGVERRGHRDVRQFERHIASVNALIEHHGSLSAWLVAPTWRESQARIAQAVGNGRWAGYKLGEILSTVYGLTPPPPDAGHADSSGPRKGLADLFPVAGALSGNHPSVVAKLDELTTRLVDRWGFPVAQVETILCDWHSTVKGAYYVGHDIDLMLEQAERARPLAGEMMLEGRRLAFDPQWLGEKAGWPGVRRELKTLYRDTGRVRWWG